MILRMNIVLCMMAASQSAIAAVEAAVEPRVEVEEVVTRYLPANNGAGPLWCYGSTVIGRVGEQVFLSVIETGKDVPPLCNTRWQLWQRPDKGPWKLVRQEEDYRQREPCPIGVDPAGKVFLSVNPSTQPPGTKYGPCKPLVLEFDAKNPAGAFATQEPAWGSGTKFTDHSYRGFSADGKNGELLLLNIHSETGEQFISYRNRQGQWQARGSIRFPIRSCYPQVLLKDKAAFVMAIGDIVEPNEEWKKLKFEKTRNSWDYVFRRLFYAWTPDIEKTAFCEPIEIDSVEKTAGHITNLDLAVDETGAVQVLYLRQPHQYDFIRDKFFPGEKMTVTLEMLTIREGKVIGKRAVAERADMVACVHPMGGSIPMPRASCGSLRQGGCRKRAKMHSAISCWPAMGRMARRFSRYFWSIRSAPSSQRQRAADRGRRTRRTSLASPPMIRICAMRGSN
jgi:hypothetical protein